MAWQFHDNGENQIIGYSCLISSFLSLAFSIYVEYEQIQEDGWQKHFEDFFNIFDIV